MNEAFTGISEISSITIIEPGHTWDYRRTRRSLGPSSLPKPGLSFRFRRWAASTIVTSGAPPKSPLTSSFRLQPVAIEPFRQGTLCPDKRSDPKEVRPPEERCALDGVRVNLKTTLQVNVR